MLKLVVIRSNNLALKCLRAGHGEGNKYVVIEYRINTRELTVNNGKRRYLA